MYPFFRVITEMARARYFSAPLALTDPHISQHRVLPGDLDMAVELNNGRTLTLMDLGRMPLFERTGLFRRVYGAGWFMTMAGVTVRYRRRVTLWQKMRLHSRIICWDARFFYLEQAMLRPDGLVANHALYRVAVADRGGIIAPPGQHNWWAGMAPRPICRHGWPLGWPQKTSAPGRPWGFRRAKITQGLSCQCHRLAVLLR